MTGETYGIGDLAFPPLNVPLVSLSGQRVRIHGRTKRRGESHLYRQDGSLDVTPLYGEVLVQPGRWHRIPAVAEDNGQCSRTSHV